MGFVYGPMKLEYTGSTPFTRLVTATNGTHTITSWVNFVPGQIQEVDYDIGAWLIANDASVFTQLA